MRHAKSSWDDAAMSDFERPLNERGRKAAPLMGEYIRKNQLQPDSIVSSPAERAKQTAQLVKESAQLESEIIFNEKIYEASVGRLLEVIGEQPETVESILLVGHNPGLEGLVKFLTGELQAMPTAALAIVDLQIDKWSEIAASKGELRDLIRPKEIEKTENGKRKVEN
jgi:phosphohistidine phosphatase